MILLFSDCLATDCSLFLKWFYLIDVHCWILNTWIRVCNKLLIYFESLNLENGSKFQLRTSYIFSPLCAVSTLEWVLKILYYFVVACTLLIDGLDYSCHSYKETSMFLFIAHLPYRMLLIYIAVFVMYRLQLLSLFHGWYSETQFRVWMPLDVLWHLLDVHSTDMWGTCSHNSHQEPLPLEHPVHPGHR